MSIRRSLAAVALAGMVAGCGGLFYQPTETVYSRPAIEGFRWRDHRIPRPGGGTLAAAFIAGRGPDSGRGLLVQFHGNAQNLSAHWRSLRWAVLSGWDLVTWDYSGYGASDGEPSQAQIARDAQAFLSWLSDSVLPGRTGPVVLVGQSLGAAILLRSFPRWEGRDRATLLLVEGGFPSYRGIARDVTTRHWLLWPLYPLVPLLVSDGESPRPWIPRTAPTPLVVVSCSEDRVVPPKFQRQIHRLAPPSALLWEVRGCGHGGAFRSDTLQERLRSLIDSLAASAAPSPAPSPAAASPIGAPQPSVEPSRADRPPADRSSADSLNPVQPRIAPR